MKSSKAKTKPAKSRRKTDRRVVRTRDTLGNALVALMREKPFEEITVQNVLDRAGVGRSTFYVHYRDKDDLFLSDVEDFFEYVSGLLTRNGADPKRLLPVRELLSHIRDVRDFHTAVVRSGKVQDVWLLGRGIFARSIEERLKLAGVVIEPAQRAAHAYALAGSFFSLVDWWIDKDMKPDPKGVDDLFHRMAWKGLASG